MNAELALEAEKPITSRVVADAILSKYAGDKSHMVLFDVPDNIGLQSKRRCDAIAVGLWGSTGRLVHGFEIKISRSDWLRELKQVDKADPFIERCDRWWLVTADDKLAKLDEIPALWGWMTYTKSGLRIQKKAAELPQPEHTMHKLFALGLLRAAYERSAGDIMQNPLVVREIELIREGHRRYVDDEIKRGLMSTHRDLAEYKTQAEKFEAASGMKLTDWKLGNVGKLAHAIADLHRSGYDSMRHSLENQARKLRECSEHIEGALRTLPQTEGET